MQNRIKPAKTQLLPRETFPFKNRKALINQQKTAFSAVFRFGTPGAIRTHGLQSRRQNICLHKIKILPVKWAFSLHKRVIFE
jgi:hypothetical protein